MPSSSRKRNKGKERKAKALAKKEEKDKEDAYAFWRSAKSMGCNHGHASSIPDDHPVFNFMDQFCLYLCYKRLVLSQVLREIFKSHRHIWNDESYRKLAIGILIHIGTNMLLLEERELSGPICVAQFIIALEHYNGTNDIDSVRNKRVVTLKWRDLGISSSERRDVLKFFRKRTTCKCLKKLHLEARKTPKLGLCKHCSSEQGRVTLSVCSRCMIEQYCSRECQVADWPEHESHCDAYVEANTN